MGLRWFILADDLTGAADSAGAFARRGLLSNVVWGEARAEIDADLVALAFDAATRELGAAAAARLHGDVLRWFQRPGVHVFKKVDSTLRGHPAEEVAAMLDVLVTQEPGMRIVMAPAFPATGRTVRDGRVLVQGVPLPFTEYWPEGRDHELANLGNLLERAGVHAQPLSLETVRGNTAALTRALANGVTVCDSETDADLDRIASACLGDGKATFCIGSAGFAHALAQCESRASEPRRGTYRLQESNHGALIIVGSRTRASRAALTELLTLENVTGVSVEPAMLVGAALSSALADISDAIGAALAQGTDVVVDIKPSAFSQPGGNPQLVASLARLLVPRARQASALVATGGETAAAMFTRLGVEGIRLVDEIEPGIPLGLTLGEISVPVVTKAGGFGDDECLKRIVSRLRFIRQTGAVA
jgi:D-threonate/D-erythronate kinase